MSFRLVPKSVTLNDLERCNGRYIALFHCVILLRYYQCKLVFRHICLSVTARYVAQSSSARVYCIVLRVVCHRKESSRSLSHLRMSFLLSTCYEQNK